MTNPEQGVGSKIKNDTYFVHLMGILRQFISACTNGDLSRAVNLYSTGKIDHNANDNLAFQCAASNRHSRVIKWLYNLGGIDVNMHGPIAFRIACAHGKMDLVQWLYGLNIVDIHANNDIAFAYACQYGHLSIAKWLYSLGNVNRYNADSTFICTCKYGNIQTVKWLYTLGNVNVNATDVEGLTPFSAACYYRNLPIVEWLSTLDGIDICINYDGYLYYEAHIWKDEHIARFLIHRGIYPSDGIPVRMLALYNKCYQRANTAAKVIQRWWKFRSAMRWDA